MLFIRYNYGRKLILLLIFFFIAIGSFGQEVIVEGEKVLLKKSEGTYKVVKPKALYADDEIKLGMTFENFKRVDIQKNEINEYGTYRYYKSSGTILNKKVDIRYRIYALDVSSYGVGPQLAKITYNLQGEYSMEGFENLSEKVEKRLDGVPLQTKLQVPEQYFKVNETSSIDNHINKIDYSILKMADCGKFNIVIKYKEGKVSITYDSSSYLLEKTTE